MGACLKAREIEWEVCWLKIVSPWLLFCLYPDGLAHRKSSHLLLCVRILFIILHYPKRDQMQPHPRNGCFKMMLFSGSAVSSSFATLARLQNKWRALRPRWGDEYGCSRLVKSALGVLMWSLKTESHPTLKEEFLLSCRIQEIRGDRNGRKVFEIRGALVGLSLWFLESPPPFQWYPFYFSKIHTFLSLSDVKYWVLEQPFKKKE